MKYDISIRYVSRWRGNIKVYDHHTQRTYEIPSNIPLRTVLDKLDDKYDGIDVEWASCDYKYPAAAGLPT